MIISLCEEKLESELSIDRLLEKIRQVEVLITEESKRQPDMTGKLNSLQQLPIEINLIDD